MIRRLILCLAALIIVIAAAADSYANDKLAAMRGLFEQQQCGDLVAQCQAEAQSPAPFVAGVAKVDITPRIGRGLDGSERSQEMRDSLFARVLVLKNQHTSVAIVSIDSLVFASPVVAEEAKRQFGVQHVIQSSTHTHAGTVPEGMMIGGPNRNPDWTRQAMAPDKVIDWRGLSRDPWYDSAEQRIIAAIGEAQRNAFPARIASGSGVFESVYMAHNRRLVTGKGVTMLWENPNRLPTKPVDPTVGILRVEDLEGKVRALAVAYACHPVALMSAGVLSRDYPGAMVDFIEQELGPQCQAMFLQGASGDLDPFDLHNLRGKNRENISKQAGISLAKRALAISGECKVVDQATDLVVKESLLEIPNRKPGEMTQVNLLTLRLSDQIAFAAIPGEPFVQHQLDLRASLPASFSALPNVFILGLAYSGRGCPFVIYIPTEQAVKEGGYGATECAFLAPHAGAMMVAELVKLLR
jgi:hypothetical protein